MRYVAGADYFVYWVPFPENDGTDGGAVVLNDDGTFSILMDEKLLRNARKAYSTYRHEVCHIGDEDFYNDKPISEIEKI